MIATRPPLRPRDAATLIMLRRRGNAAEVLMGHRSARHVFMPNTFVFPGGRVDPEDNHVEAASELRPSVLDRLKRNATPRRARALALAALREAYEETGLAVGLPHHGVVDWDRLPDAWREFHEQGLAPRLDVLDYVFRAITPPNETRRFHARFFIVDARHASGELGGSGELVDLQWIPIERSIAMPNTPNVTGSVLREISRLLRRADPTALPAAHPVPLFHGTRHGERVRRR